jgi:hypothetical protein
MVNRQKMWAVVIMGALTATTAFTGCGKKTIDYDIDGNEGEAAVNSSTSGDSGSLAGRLGIPESYEGNLEIGNSGLSKISIDADEIQVPSADKMSIANATIKNCTNEYKQQVCEAVFDKSQGIYLNDYENQTKEDLQKTITIYEGYKKEAMASGDDGSWYDEYINELKSQMADAPDEYEGAGDYSGSSFIGTIGSNKFILDIANGGENGIYMSMYTKDSALEFRPYEGAAQVSYYNADYSSADDDSVNECSLSKDNAQRMAEELLNDLGMDNCIMTNISDLAWEYYDSSWETIATELDGYIVTFARGINDTPVYNGYLWNLDNLSMDDGYINIPGDSYQITVNDTGIIGIDISSYYEFTGDTSDSAELLTWDELLAKANENIPAYYEKYPTKYKKVEFNDVRLTYYMDADSENDNQLRYIPVWVFSQYDDYQDSDQSIYPEQLVVLDATTGEAIDLIGLAKDMGFYRNYGDVIVDDAEYKDYYEDDDADDIEDDSVESDIDSSDEESDVSAEEI